MLNIVIIIIDNTSFICSANSDDDPISDGEKKDSVIWKVDNCKES